MIDNKCILCIMNTQLKHLCAIETLLHQNSTEKDAKVNMRKTERIRKLVAQIVNDAFGRSLVGDEKIHIMPENVFTFDGDRDIFYHWKILESERGANMIWLFERSSNSDGYHDLAVGDQVVITIPSMAIVRPADDKRLPERMFASIDTPADVIHYRIPTVMVSDVNTLVQAIAEADRLSVSAQKNCCGIIS